MTLEDELKKIDLEWKEEEEKYVTVVRGQRHEPTAPEFALFLAVIGAVTGVALLVSGTVAPLSPELRRYALGVGGVISVLVLFPIRLYVNSLRYHKARSAYLRNRAAVKTQLDALQGSGPPSGGAPTGHAQACPPFCAMAFFSFARDRLYRIYLVDGVLYFIQIADQLTAGKVAMNEVDNLDRQRPQDLMPAHKNNMAIPIADIASATIDLPGWFDGAHGPHLGIWRMKLHTGTKWSFQFNFEDDMKRACHGLPAALQDRLLLRTRWDDAAGAFVKA
jgi:hypothetical protein